MAEWLAGYFVAQAVAVWVVGYAIFLALMAYLAAHILGTGIASLDDAVTLAIALLFVGCPAFSLVRWIAKRK